MITIPNQSSLPTACLEFENGRMKVSPFYNRIVDVIDQLARLTVIMRGRKGMLVDCYSEKVEGAEELIKLVLLKEI